MDRTGSVSVTSAFLLPVLIVLAGLAIDGGFWIIGSTRLQIAADAAAFSAAVTMQTSTFQAEPALRQASDLQAIAVYEATAASGRLPGTTIVPSVTYDTSKYRSVTVTLTSQASSLFAGAVNVTPPNLRVSSTAGVAPIVSAGTAPACVITLDLTGNSLLLDNSGTINATNCGVYVNSIGNPSIYVNNATLKASSILTSGTASVSGSGSNVVSPSPQSLMAPIVDPFALAVLPAVGLCNGQTNNYTSYGTYALTPTIWCGNVTIGGNGSTSSFAPGLYVIVNGDLVINNANITSANGVTFLMTGTNPGKFSYTNYSGGASITAPTTGPTAGIVLWQTCGLSPQQDSIQGGSTLTIGGAIYAPCARMDIGNNAQLTAPLNGVFSLVTGSLYVHGSATINPTAVSVAGTRLVLID